MFLRVWSKADTYRQDRASVVTWMIRIARNRAIDTLRCRPRDLSRPWDLAPAEGVNPAEAFELAEDQQEVARALETLNPDQRRALWLAYQQGLTHNQIAEGLGEPLGTVKSRIRDSLLKLKDVLSRRRGR